MKALHLYFLIFFLPALTLSADEIASPKKADKAQPKAKPAPQKAAQPAKTSQKAKKKTSKKSPNHTAKKTKTPGATAPGATQKAATSGPKDPQLAKLEKEKSLIAAETSLADERVKKELTDLRNEVARLKLQKEKLAEEKSIAELKLEQELRELDVKTLRQEALLKREATLAKARADKLTSELKARETEASLATAKISADINKIKAENAHDSYSRSEPKYLKKPLQKDGTLIISDRRIELNGPISYHTADAITERIHYFNNKNKELPIFIVIDASPGGSVMAGYRILKAMEASEAPIHVVVKSFAASMAACITTLAQESYAYPNALILHHQINAVIIGNYNLTQQKEIYEMSQRWWERLAQPVADKMGITREEFIKKMYAKSSSGDWDEFADEAQKLKWVDHLITGIRETAITRNPDIAKKDSAANSGTSNPNSEVLTDQDGKAYQVLPRLQPLDVYFLHNPDNYYRAQ